MRRPGQTSVRLLVLLALLTGSVSQGVRPCPHHTLMAASAAMPHHSSGTHGEDGDGHPANHPCTCPGACPLETPPLPPPTSELWLAASLPPDRVTPLGLPDVVAPRRSFLERGPSRTRAPPARS